MSINNKFFAPCVREKVLVGLEWIVSNFETKIIINHANVYMMVFDLVLRMILCYNHLVKLSIKIVSISGDHSSSKNPLVVCPGDWPFHLAWSSTDLNCSWLRSHLQFLGLHLKYASLKMFTMVIFLSCCFICHHRFAVLWPKFTSSHTCTSAYIHHANHFLSLSVHVLHASITLWYMFIMDTLVPSCYTEMYGWCHHSPIFDCPYLHVTYSPVYLHT